MADYIIQTENLTVGYNKKLVVENVNIGLEEGQIMAVIGPNGSGKTTILKSICRLIPEISGSVSIEGKPFDSYSSNEIAKLMAVVFTDQTIKETISCHDVVAMGRFPYTGILGRLSKDDEEIITEAMLSTSVLDLMDRDFTRLSDGQRQRVLLARALAQKPKLLILDEPTTFLDVKYTLEFLALLRKLAKENGFAVVMSVHELDMARQIADKILTVKNNKVDRFGSSDEIFTEGYINYLFDIETGFFDENQSRAIVFKE